MSSIQHQNNWVDEELSSVNLGDKRLNKRLNTILKSFSNQPENSIPTRCENWQETKAAYRFLDNPEATPEKVLAPHIQATLTRVASEKIVLCLQDTSDIDFTGRKSVIGLGYTGKASQPHCRGFFLHPTLAVTPERLCLGVLHSKTWIREEAPEPKTRARNSKSIDEKESVKWLESFKNTQSIATSLPETQFINVSDRESDVIELFWEAEKSSLKNAHFIVRSMHNRKTETTLKLWETLKAQEAALGEVEFVIPEGRGRKARTVKQAIYSSTITLKAPKQKRKCLSDIKLQAVLASEIDVPMGEEPVEWLLLTSLPVGTFESALLVVDYYLCRWQIEIYFKVIKSGCQIEKLQLEHIDRILCCLAIYMIIAWRILFTTMLGRVAPNLPCDKVFSEAEWKSVYIMTHKKQAPEQVPSLNEFIKMVAQLGGFLNRKRDGEPGVKTLWIGMQRMRDFALSWEMFHIL